MDDLRYGFGLRAIEDLVAAIIRDPGTGDPEVDDYAVERIKEVATYWLELIEVREKREAKLAKIAALRNTAGRSPEEVKVFLAKADELEREL